MVVLGRELDLHKQVTQKHTKHLSLLRRVIGKLTFNSAMSVELL